VLQHVRCRHRSSQTLNATLYDFARGSLGECKSTTTTTPRDFTDHTIAPASSIPVDPAAAKVEATDQTDITVTPAGHRVQRLDLVHICGPTASSSTQLWRRNGRERPVSISLTEHHCGRNVLLAKGNGDEGRTVLLPRSVLGDSSVGVPGSSDSRSSECFTVAPAQPTLTTDATDGPVDFGGKISDSVTLSGTAHKGGTGGPTGSDGSINPTTLGGDATGDNHGGRVRAR